jgi:hypothetical protein
VGGEGAQCVAEDGGSRWKREEGRGREDDAGVLEAEGEAGQDKGPVVLVLAAGVEDVDVVEGGGADGNGDGVKGGWGVGQGCY